MSTDDNGIVMKDLLENYWHSRGLILIGILLAGWCPFATILLPIVMTVDFFAQNPVLPFGVGLTPQEVLFESILWVQVKYKWMKDQCKHFQADKTKKTE